MKTSARQIAIPALLLLGWVGAADPPSVARVERRALVKYVTLTGDLQAAESVSITAPHLAHTWTYTISHLAPEGSEVRPADLLAEFDASSLHLKRLDLEKKREEARLQMAQKEAEIEGRRQDLLLNLASAEKSLRVAALYFGLDPTLITQVDAEQYQLNHSKAQLELEKVKERLANLEKSARAEMEIARLDYDEAELELKRVLAELERMRVRAPIPGLVIYGDNWDSGRKYQVGDVVFRSDRIILLPNMKQVKVLAFAYDSDFPLLREGMQAEVILDSAPGRTFRGRVTELPEAASPKTSRSSQKVFRVGVLLLETDAQLMKPGMTARVRIPVRREDVLVVPRRALHLNEKGEVFVTPRDSGRPLAVEIVDANADLVALLAADESSLKEGELLLLENEPPRSLASGQIEWLAVKREDLVFSVSGSGVLAAEKAVTIRPPSLSDYRSFKIVRMVEEGSRVKEGDFLLEFDRSEIQRRLREEEANHRKAQQEYEKTQASLQLNLKDLELQLEEARVQREKAENKLTQSREFEGLLKVKEAEFEATLARQRVEMTEKKLHSLQRRTGLQLQLLEEKESFYERRIQASRAALEALEVKASISGVVIYRSNWNNEKKQVGSNAHLMETILEIPDLSTLVVEGQVAEVDAGKIRVGQRVMLTLDAIAEQTFEGRIVEVSTIFRQVSFDRPVKVLPFKAKLGQIDARRMRPGMAARLQVVVDDYQGVLSVPLSALRAEAGKSYLWVKEKETPVKREVRIGKDNGMVAVVEAGLRAGEEIASRPPL